MLVLPRDLGFFELGNGEPVGRLGALPGPGPLPLPQGGHLTPVPLPLPAGEGGLWETGWPCRMGPFWQPHVLVIAGSLCSHSPGLRPGWPSWFLVGQVAQVALGWQGSPCPAGLLLLGQLPSFPPSFRLSCPGGDRPQAGEVSCTLNFILCRIFLNLDFKQLQVK